MRGVKLLACDDLVALQNENEEYFDMLWSEVGPVVFVPVSIDTYRSLEENLCDMVKNALECINDSVEKMDEAFSMMNIPFDKEDLIEQMSKNMLAASHVGKVLDSKLLITDRDENYITYDNDDDYDEENGEDDYEDDDDDI